MKTKYNIVHTGDNHIGATKADVTLYQLDTELLDKIDEMETVDVIFIAGDLFHTKISVNSKHYQCFLIFFCRLLKIAKEKNAKIRIIKGTESHDYKQLEYITPLIENSGVDCKIYSTVGVEYLFDNLKVLYIPEEYMENKDEFYKEYFNQEYDIIVMHGLVTETCFAAKKQESGVTMSKAPVFDTKLLMKICRGPILAAHIHTKTIIKDAVYYPGSFLRWVFGEEDPKGFNFVTYDTENSDYNVKFIENMLADRYDTTILSLSNNIEDVTTFVDEYSKQFDTLSGNGIKYRIIFNIPDDFPKTDLAVKVINEFFSRKENVKILINNNSKVKAKANTAEKLDLLYKKYGKVLDKRTTVDEKVHFFIKEKFGVDISLEKINDYLHKPINYLEGEQ